MTFKKGQSGNPAGRKKGVKLKRNQFLYSFESEILKKLVDQALAGDIEAIRIYIDRVIPKPRDRFIAIQLPDKIDTRESLLPLATAILRSVEAQDLTPLEAKTMLENINLFSNSILMEEVVATLNALIVKTGFKNEITPLLTSSSAIANE